MQTNIFREPNKQYVLSISYGKDSLACLGAIEKLKLPLDRIIHAEVWATDTIPADLPPMVEFKKKADRIIKDRWGIEVEHFYAIRRERERESNKTLRILSRVTFESYFYTKVSGTKNNPSRENIIYGFPYGIGAWCNSRLKVAALKECEKNIRNGFLQNPKEETENKRFSDCTGELVSCVKNVSDTGKSAKRIGVETVSYIGIAEDEPERLARLDGITKISPLHLIGWTEQDCMNWCIENDLRSPLYNSADRGGCWFCHNQSIDQLRHLRHEYPELWALMLKWDLDSPVSFRADGHTVHDFDKRFQLEDDGYVTKKEHWKWKYLDNPPEKQINLFELGEI